MRASDTTGRKRLLRAHLGNNRRGPVYQGPPNCDVCFGQILHSGEVFQQPSSPLSRDVTQTLIFFTEAPSLTGGVLLCRHTAGRRERRGELVHRLCVQLRACRRRALGASPIRPTLADGRSPSSSISACSVFARLPCRIMDGRELSEGGTYEHPDIRHEEKLRY